MFRMHAGVTRSSVRTHMHVVANETSPMPNDPHLLGVLITTTGVGLAMTWLAARMSMIELRRGAWDREAIAEGYVEMNVDTLAIWIRQRTAAVRRPEL